jgi:hypothetical protein
VTASIRCEPFSRYDPFHVGQDHPLRGHRRACGHMASSHLIFDRGPAALAFCKIATMSALAAVCGAAYQGRHTSAFGGKSGHRNHRTECPLSGVKRTWLFAAQMSAFDPKRTWTGALHMSAYELLRQRHFPIYEAVMDLRAIFPLADMAQCCSSCGSRTKERRS